MGNKQESVLTTIPSDEKTNCLVVPKQFHKLSRRQWTIYLALVEKGCLNAGDIAHLCTLERAKGFKPDPNSFLAPKGATPAEHRKIIQAWSCDMCTKRPEDFRWKLMSSVYRTMRELEKRDLVLRLQGKKPAVWTWIDWSNGKPEWGRFHENRYVNSDTKFWNTATWKSRHYTMKFGDEKELTAKQLRQRIKYYENLYHRGINMAVRYSIQAEKKGLLKDKKWIDEM